MMYGFDVMIRDVAGNDTAWPDRVWVGADSQEQARLTALATWPRIVAIDFYKAIREED